MNLVLRVLWFIEAKVLILLAHLLPHRYGITVVLTSCARHDLLSKTLDSLLKFNSFPLRKIIIVEDGGQIATELAAKYESWNIDWISTGERVGQIAAIDYAYSRVETPYIFHMEDDWEFYESSFIEKSMAILLRNPQIIQVWLRGMEDVSYRPIDKEIFKHLSIVWRKVTWDWETEWGTWHGFSFNPGLRRLKDYRVTNGFGSLCTFDFRNPGKTEAAIGEYYRKSGFFAVILSDLNGQGYVRHIGWDLTVKPPGN